MVFLWLELLKDVVNVILPVEVLLNNVGQIWMPLVSMNIVYELVNI